MLLIDPHSGRDIPTYGALIVSLRGAVAHLLESGQPVPWRPVGDFLELLENSLGKMGMQAKQQVWVGGGPVWLWSQFESDMWERIPRPQ